MGLNVPPKIAIFCIADKNNESVSGIATTTDVFTVESIRIQLQHFVSTDAKESVADLR
jgi:hypothetical protein